MVEISWNDFEKVDMRIGTITAVEDFPEAKKPAYKLTVFFGDEIGSKRSSAQITDLYSKEDLDGKQVMAVINFPPKQIGPFISECLVMGAYNEDGHVVLLEPEQLTTPGSVVG